MGAIVVAGCQGDVPRGMPPADATSSSSEPGCGAAVMGAAHLDDVIAALRPGFGDQRPPIVAVSLPIHQHAVKCLAQWWESHLGAVDVTPFATISATDLLEKGTGLGGVKACVQGRVRRAERNGTTVEFRSWDADGRESAGIIVGETSPPARGRPLRVCGVVIGRYVLHEHDGVFVVGQLAPHPATPSAPNAGSGPERSTVEPPLHPDR